MTSMRRLARGKGRLALVVATWVVAGCATARVDAPDGAGQVTALVGEAVVVRPGIAVQNLGVQSRVFARDRIQTREASRAQITLADQSVMSIGERTDVEIQEFRFDAGSRVRNLFVRIAQGIMRMSASSTAATGPVSLSANLASVTFSGTEAVVEVTASRTAVASLEGRVRVTSSQPGITGAVELGPGEGTDVDAGAAPKPAAVWGAARLERVKQATRVP